METEFYAELECLVDCAGTAFWRRRKSEQYPEDARNVAAADALEKLANGITLLEGSELHYRLLQSYEANEDASEVISECLRVVGFGFLPESAADLIESIISRLS